MQLPQPHPYPIVPHLDQEARQYAVPNSSLANSIRLSADDFADNHVDHATSLSLEYQESAPIPFPIPDSDPPAYSATSPPAHSPNPSVYEPTALGLDDPALWSNAEPPPTATGSFHPRAAVILGLNVHWHKWLYFCRLLSVFPELRFGIPILWTLLWCILGDEEVRTSFEAKGNLLVVFMEVFLAAVWCAVSGYLSFFSMDCLMMRWLLIYSPIASIVRLITASFIYYVGTNFILQYSGSNLDPTLPLPAWILIAAIVAIVYMSMHNRTTIKRQGDNSMYVLGAASYFTMCVLLAALYIGQQPSNSCLGR
ncbi:N-glycosylation protein EOS1 [Venturia nashicola]|uniref:N-glycosylation protein EOS1 n=1 Tax=Venturia nashicola TaxID=86259 RepID=A0A4Z1P1F7_9PEZI|nr:N-glycosylation protein EOS1 [Venturia nashicola]